MPVVAIPTEIASPLPANRRQHARAGMRRKLLFAILLLLIISQVPFAYRRYRLHRLRTVIQQLATQRTMPAAETQYVDFRGVIHVHSFLGGHSTGTFAEILDAATANQLNFVIMTEHPQANFDTSAMTLNGAHDGVLFVNGNEVATASGDRLLLIPGSAGAAVSGRRSTEEIVAEQKSNGGLSFVAYPSESQNWQTTAANGVEVYNLFTNARQINSITMFFDGLWSYRSYADLMFADFFTRPEENLRLWDNMMANGDRKLVAIAGNDAHSNVGVSLNNASGKQLIGIKLDPYERSFRVVRNHVLIRKGTELNRESLLQALSQGHCYLAYDIFADASGFDFSVSNSDVVMGDEIALDRQPQFVINTPVASRMVIIKNGSIFGQQWGTSAQFTPGGPGSYRVEVYLDALPAPAKGQPWIISNPIYVK
jgi:hypothetical protein